jgi:hypothetical protein
MANTIADVPDHICPALTGTRIPEVRVATAGGEVFDLNAAVAKQRAVIVFYRGGW